MRVVVCNKCGAKNRVEENRLTAQEARCGRCKNRLTAGDFNEDRPVQVSDGTFERDVLQASSERPVMLDCWAPWCGPCRVVGPIMDQLASESHGRYRVAKLNVDENPRVASEFRISSIPTMLIFKNGKLVDRLIGAQPKQAIVDRLAAVSQSGARS